MHMLKAEYIQEYGSLQDYSVRLGNALLSSTVPNASYVDIHGAVIISENVSVQNMIIQELLLIEAGVPVENFGGKVGYNERIEMALSSLLDRDIFHCRLIGKYGEHEVDFGDPPPETSKETAAYTYVVQIPGNYGAIETTLLVWKEY